MNNLISLIIKKNNLYDINSLLIKEYPDLNLDDKKYIVISIIGKEKTGKSSLLNLIISYLSNNNKYIFNVFDFKKSCTKDINYYIYKNYIFLDYTKSNDEEDKDEIEDETENKEYKLMSILYLLSDIIIYNDKSYFCADSFIDFFKPLINEKNIKKPNLFVRIFEYKNKSKYDIINTLNINKKKDYQIIKNSIIKLFSNIHNITTNVLSKEEEKYLKEHSFLNILKNENNNFVKSIKNIILLTNIYNKNNGINRYSINEFFDKIKNINEKLCKFKN